MEVDQFPDLSSVDSNDKIFGYSPSANQVGLISLNFIVNNGYACRRWNESLTSPVGEAVGNIEYLRQLPSLLGLGCYLVDNNHGRRKLSPVNHYNFADGSAASLDGSMGHYMWGWGTTWYYANWREGSYYYEAASLKPIPGRHNYVIPVASTSALGVSVVDRTNSKLVSYINNSSQYRGGDNSATIQEWDSTYRTQLGRAATKLSAADFATFAAANGTGWEAYWYTFPAIIGALFRIIFGTRDVQSSYNATRDSDGLYQGGLGSGVTGCGSWWSGDDGFKYYPFLPTSVGVELGDSCGVSSYAVPGPSGTLTTVNVPVFFGLKNFYGYLNRIERGKTLSKKAGGGADVYVLSKMRSSYTPSSLTGMTKVSEMPPNSIASGYEYIMKMSMQNLCNTPTVFGGTSSTGYCDAVYNDNSESGLRAAVSGGYANYGGSAGPGFLYASDGVSYAYAHSGSPLCEAEEDWDTTPVLVAS